MNPLRIISYISLLLLILPVAVLLYWGLGPFNTPIGYGTQVQKSIMLTIFASALAVVFEVVLFTPLSYFLSRNANPVAETLADIPAVIPHPIVGVALLVLDSPLTPTGKFLLSIGINFFDTLTGLVAALVIVSAPFYIKSMQGFFQSMSPAKEYYALGLGASRMRTFLFVVLPNSIKGLLNGALIAMSRAMSEFGSIAIVAYLLLQAPFSLSGTSPASVLIFQYYSYYGLPAAVSSSAVLILVSIPLMIGVRLVGRIKTGTF
ncbi:MAG: ABC transporter permease [Nitrososphaerota archaeon]|nr:ABC transporter permease [Nitrososphaerota archaeon]